jgi:hypothetical protein
MSNLYFKGNTYIFGATAPKNIGTGSVSYNFTGLTSDTNYKFIIVSTNSLGFSGIVGPINLRTLELIEYPIAPSGFTALSENTLGITFSWFDNSTNEIGFKIFYRKL